jgi:hypothetical protein
MRFPRLLPTLGWQFPTEIKASLLGSYVLSLGQALAVLSVYFRLPPVVPLWYTMANAQDQLAAKEWLLIIPALSITVSIVHTLLAPLLNEYGPLLMKLFGWATVVVHVVFALSLLRIIMIIT